MSNTIPPMPEAVPGAPVIYPQAKNRFKPSNELKKFVSKSNFLMKNSEYVQNLQKDIDQANSFSPASEIVIIEESDKNLAGELQWAFWKIFVNDPIIRTHLNLFLPQFSNSIFRRNGQVLEGEEKEVAILLRASQRKDITLEEVFPASGEGGYNALVFISRNFAHVLAFAQGQSIQILLKHLLWEAISKRRINIAEFESDIQWYQRRLNYLNTVVKDSNTSLHSLIRQIQYLELADLREIAGYIQRYSKFSVENYSSSLPTIGFDKANQIESIWPETDHPRTVHIRKISNKDEYVVVDTGLGIFDPEAEANYNHQPNSGNGSSNITGSTFKPVENNQDLVEEIIIEATPDDSLEATTVQMEPVIEELKIELTLEQIEELERAERKITELTEILQIFDADEKFEGNYTKEILRFCVSTIFILFNAYEKLLKTAARNTQIVPSTEMEEHDIFGEAMKSFSSHKLLFSSISVEEIKEFNLNKKNGTDLTTKGFATHVAIEYLKALYIVERLSNIKEAPVNNELVFKLNSYKLDSNPIGDDLAKRIQASLNLLDFLHPPADQDKVKKPKRIVAKGFGTPIAFHESEELSLESLWKVFDANVKSIGEVKFPERSSYLKWYLANKNDNFWKTNNIVLSPNTFNDIDKIMDKATKLYDWDIRKLAWKEAKDKYGIQSLIRYLIITGNRWNLGQEEFIECEQLKNEIFKLDRMNVDVLNRINELSEVDQFNIVIMRLTQIKETVAQELNAIRQEFSGDLYGKERAKEFTEVCNIFLEYLNNSMNWQLPISRLGHLNSMKNLIDERVLQAKLHFGSRIFEKSNTSVYPDYQILLRSQISKYLISTKNFLSGYIQYYYSKNLLSNQETCQTLVQTLNYFLFGINNNSGWGKRNLIYLTNHANVVELESYLFNLSTKNVIEIKDLTDLNSLIDDFIILLQNAQSINT